ncbi:hypothetical protein [Pararhizobium qamdonense]|uniref:hypothetical protein n=1 Tax=Pararhizobium qamdonense TaxID=3031126 RepID=UPI0023E223D6|nr:hypothetical protein [Pararhizobium qamdonense]
MIDFAILPDERDQTGWIEIVRVQVSFDLKSCHYSPTTREVTAAELEGLIKKAIRMRCPDSGDAYLLAITGFSDKCRENPDAMQKHLKGYLNHPIRYVIMKEIERRNASN